MIVRSPVELLLRSRLTLDVHGAEELGEPTGPVLVAANHASPADAQLVLAALPRSWRRELMVCLPADVERRRRWTPVRRSVVIGSDTGRTAVGVLEELLGQDRSVLCFPEDARSRDGYLGTFRPEILAVAQQRGLPVLPVGLRGAYAAVPDDSPLPLRIRPGRPRVSVRIGTPTRSVAGESAVDFAARVEQEVRRLIAEDASSWWDTQLLLESEPVAAPGSSWRRIWEQTEAPTAGGRPRRPKIWRS